MIGNHVTNALQSLTYRSSAGVQLKVMKKLKLIRVIRETYLAARGRRRPEMTLSFETTTMVSC